MKVLILEDVIEHPSERLEEILSKSRKNRIFLFHIRQQEKSS